ncbi:hypothetical protein LCGC14_0526430 [marine sediment metagenome]|uniref:Uncharacterized protein n=1 Tax=marine sediment metagenome TaxID=412755 RepID=A0A0F9V554_9ZZZZ
MINKCRVSKLVTTLRLHRSPVGFDPLTRYQMEEQLKNVKVTVYFDHKNANQDTHDPTTKERRDMKKVGECQTIKMIENPNVEHLEGWISRMRLDRAVMTDIFSRAHVTVQSQRLPIQIIIHEKDDDKEKDTLIENIWIEKNGV